jgi:hypothetical protein
MEGLIISSVTNVGSVLTLSKSDVHAPMQSAMKALTVIRIFLEYNFMIIAVEY